MSASSPSPQPAPLRRADPPQLGDVELEGRLGSSDAGFVYAGRAGERKAVVVVLTEGAEHDPYGRARFLRAVDELRDRRDGQVLGAETDPDVAPWVAIAVESWADGTRLGRDLLAPVTMAHVPHDEAVVGPDYRPHWYQRIGVGRWRLWPPPWPRALTSSGRWTFVASFALVLLIAALALWIAVRIFQNVPPGPQPPAPQPPGPTPPSPTEVSPTTTGPTQTAPQSPGPSGSPTVPPIV